MKNVNSKKQIKKRSLLRVNYADYHRKRLSRYQTISKFSTSQSSIVSLKVTADLTRAPTHIASQLTYSKHRNGKKNIVHAVYKFSTRSIKSDTRLIQDTLPVKCYRLLWSELLLDYLYQYMEIME